MLENLFYLFCFITLLCYIPLDSYNKIEIKYLK